MASHIREIFTRALGGPRPGPARIPLVGDDGDRPTSPMQAAGMLAADPDAEDLGAEGATPSTVLLPEGLDALPSAAVDTSPQGGESIDEVQSGALAELAVAAAIVEGDPPPEELTDLLESLHEVPGLEDFTEPRFRRLVRTLAREEDRSAHDYVARMEHHLDELGTRVGDPALRAAAYELAVYFCAWDGDITDAETDFLDAAAEALELGADEASTLRSLALQELGGALSESIGTDATSPDLPERPPSWPR